MTHNVTDSFQFAISSLFLESYLTKNEYKSLRIHLLAINKFFIEHLTSYECEIPDFKKVGSSWGWNFYEWFVCLINEDELFPSVKMTIKEERSLLRLKDILSKAYSRYE